MNINRIENFIDEYSEGRLRYQDEIIKELSKDKEDLIYFLAIADEFYFMYVVQFLENIIIKFYSEDFMRKFKEVVIEKYNMLSNINISNDKTSYFKCND